MIPAATCREAEARHQPATKLLTPCWYAAYTCANHEKRIAQQLEEREIEHFLPLYETVHRWRDRRVRLELPLFPGYVFVRLLLQERLRVLELPSVVRLVGYGPLPIALPDEEVEVLRHGLHRDLEALPHVYPAKGRRVRILRGPLAGLEGILLRRAGNFRVVLSVDLILRSITVNVNAGDVIPVEPNALDTKNAAMLDPLGPEHRENRVPASPTER
jgi:transcription termination/antitermination protein NusG